jgi:hypothetical protein
MSRQYISQKESSRNTRHIYFLDRALTLLERQFIYVGVDRQVKIIFGCSLVRFLKLNYFEVFVFLVYDDLLINLVRLLGDTLPFI